MSNALWIVHGANGDLIASVLGDLGTSIGADLGASFEHLGAPRPEPRQGCVRTHPWTPPQGLCPLTPLVRGSPQAPRMPERFALSCVARPMTTGFVVAEFQFRCASWKFRWRI
jgi:hypothetical protein